MSIGKTYKFTISLLFFAGSILSAEITPCEFAVFSDWDDMVDEFLSCHGTEVQVSLIYAVDLFMVPIKFMVLPLFLTMLILEPVG